MLPAARRMTSPVEFTATVRRGRRAGRGTLVVHLLVRSSPAPARVGFVVSRTVGAAVVRNRVRRRLRHLLRARLDALPAGTAVVVRALPAAAGAGSSRLDTDLDAALRRLLASPEAAR